jgi:hypothetical protein
MQDRPVPDASLGGKPVQPGDVLVVEQGAGGWCVAVEQQREEGGELRRSRPLAVVLVGALEQLVGVPEHAVPAQARDAIDDGRRPRPHEGEVTAVDHDVPRVVAGGRR